jgi:hypothetical protein
MSDRSDLILPDGAGLMRREPPPPLPDPEYLTVAEVRIDIHTASDLYLVWASPDELDALVREIESHGYKARWVPARPVRPQELRGAIPWLFEE